MHKLIIRLDLIFTFVFIFLHLLAISTTCAADDASSLNDVESLRSLIFAPEVGEVVAAADFSQSNICSPEDDRYNRQCFSELPPRHYEVLEGHPVRMRCRVTRQRGKVQWRAHNTLLGKCT